MDAIIRTLSATQWIVLLTILAMNAGFVALSYNEDHIHSLSPSSFYTETLLWRSTKMWRWWTGSRLVWSKRTRLPSMCWDWWPWLPSSRRSVHVWKFTPSGLFIELMNLSYSLTSCSEHKCQYCCSIASWYCWGKTHFCDSCHFRQQKGWRARYTNGVQITNKNAILGDYITKYAKDRHPKCPGKEACPLKIEHPPNGEPYVLGCAICKELGGF